MIREKTARREASGSKKFLLIVIVSVVIFIMSAIVGYFQNTFKIYNLEIVIYVSLLVFIIVLIKLYFTEYRYSFFEDEIIIEKLLGKKITPLVSVRIWDITYFGPILDNNWQEDEMKIDSCDVSKKDVTLILYSNKGAKCALTFNPSKELISQVQRAIKNKDSNLISENEIIS